MIPISFSIHRGADHDTDHDVLALAGPLSLAAVPTVRRLLAKLLADRGRVAADLTDVSLEWVPAVEVFPAALSAAGGWPAARLVLVDPSPGLAGALHAARVQRTVPVVDPAGVLAGLDTRPPRVGRQVALARGPEAAGLARTLVRDACQDWAVPAGDAVMVVNELVTNAIQHARTSCRVSVGLDRRGLHLAVRDGAPGTGVRTGPVAVDADRGRGLHLVVLLSTAWGVVEHPDGKTVWAILDAAPVS